MKERKDKKGLEAAGSADATGAGAAGAPPESAEIPPATESPAAGNATQAARGAKGPDELRQQIAETRAQLGDTVEELAAKADVRGRARARGAALKGKASEAGHAVQDKAAHAGHAVQESVPKPVRTTTTAVVRTGRRHPRPLLIAGAGAVIAAGMLRRRPQRHGYMTGLHDITGHRHIMTGYLPLMVPHARGLRGAIGLRRTGFGPGRRTGFRGPGRTGFRGLRRTGIRGFRRTGFRGLSGTGFRGLSRTGLTARPWRRA